MSIHITTYLDVKRLSSYLMPQCFTLFLVLPVYLFVKAYHPCLVARIHGESEVPAMDFLSYGMFDFSIARDEDVLNYYY